MEDGVPRLCWRLQSNHHPPCLCIENNRTSGVWSLFIAGVHNFGIPSRVRCDHGLENTGVARLMLYRRGLNRHSVITGRSVNNQRIDRLWAELNRVVSLHFVNLFDFEEHGVSLNQLHLSCFHYIYLPRIQRAHSSSTVIRGHSIYNAGMHNPVAHIDSGFGIDDNGRPNSLSCVSITQKQINWYSGKKNVTDVCRSWTEKQLSRWDEMEEAAVCKWSRRNVIPSFL